MSKFGDYVKRLDSAITEFLRAWEESPAQTRSDHLLYITLTRSIMLSIDRALEQYAKDPEVTELAVAHLEATAMLMVEIADQLMTQIEKIIELH